MKIVLPLPPNLANGRMHWRTKKRHKDRFYEQSDTRQLVGLVPPPPERPVERAKVTVALYLHQRMDPDNAHARTKWPLDWLVKRKYLADDRSENVVLTVTQAIDRKNQRVEVEVVPMEVGA